MFKGTATLGALDWDREKDLHEQIRAAEDALIGRTQSLAE